ncbi:MAG: hypothetical protein ACKOW3_00590 [Hyphomicrobium sp.]
MSPAQSHHFFTPPVSTRKDQKETKSSSLEQVKEPEFPTSKKIEALSSNQSSMFSNSVPVWMVLGVGAFLYIGLVFLGPNILPKQNKDQNQTSQIDSILSPNKDLELIPSQIEILKKDITELKGILSDTNAQQRSLAERVAVMDNKFETTAAKVSTLAEVQAKSDKSKNILDKGTIKNTDLATLESNKTKKDPLGKPKELSQGSDSLKIINSTKTNTETQSIETSSVEPPSQQAAAENWKSSTNKAISPNIGLQIATGSSLESLRLSWNLLSEKHSDNLKSLEPRYRKNIVGNEEVFSLLVGPVVSEAEAKKMCKDLGSKAIPCDIVKEFGGEAL